MPKRTRDQEYLSPRRSVLKGLAVTAMAAGCVTTANSRPLGSPRAGHDPLEVTPSAVSFVVYAGADGLYSEDDQAADADVTDPFEDFGFPVLPAASGTDTDGTKFDTTDPTVSANGETIWYFLQYGGRQTPYRLGHQGGGTYHSQGAAVDFEWTANERFALPFFTVGETYRAVVRDVVQLYEPGGAFDWSASRTDFSDQPSGRHVASLLTIVWDEDGPDNGEHHERGAPGRPVGHTNGPSQPTFPQSASPTFDGMTIAETVTSLVRSGVSDDGIV